MWRNVHVTIALSGGADSVALLRGLVELKKQSGGRGIVSAAHVNHNLRGERSKADENWCAEFCQELEVPLSILHADTLGESEAVRDGIEAAARSQRYQLLTTAAEDRGARYLVTAHTEDDQVETVLMRILRGSGLRGLSGIPASRPLTPSLTVVRPLLSCRRVEIESYLESLQQPFCTDQSNFSDQFTRNRIRHELLPLLREQYNQEINAVLLRLASQSQDSHKVVEQQAQELLRRCDVKHGAQAVSMDCEPWNDQSSVIVCEALRMVWRDADLPEQAMTFEWWRRLAQLGTNPEVLNLPGNIRAEMLEGRLALSWS